MRTTDLFLALGLALAAAGTAPAQPAAPATAPLAADSGVTDNTASLQARVDAAFAASRADPPDGAARIDLPGRPSGFYGLSSPIYVDGPNLEIRGDGLTTRLGAAGYYAGPLLVPGVRRVADPTVYRPRADWLGPTALDATGQPRRALDTNGAAYFVVGAGHALQLGPVAPGGGHPDYWGSASGYTWEFNVRFPGTGALDPDGQPYLVALVDPTAGNTPCPWAFRADQGNFGFALRKAGQPRGACSTVVITAGPPNPGGDYDVCFRHDPVSGNVTAWVNGRPAGCAPANIGPGPLDDNDGLNAMTIGSATGTIPPNAGQLVRFQLGGLRVSRGPVYTTVKGQQARIDGTAVVAATRYFQEVRGALVQPVGLLNLDDPPATHFAARGNGLNGVGFIFEVAHAGDYPTTAFRLNGVHLRSRGQAPLVFSNFVKARVTDVKLDGGCSQGLATINTGGNYVLTLRDAQIDATDAAVSVEYMMLHASDIYCNVAGRDTLRARGAVTTWENVFLGDAQPHTRSFFRFPCSAAAAKHVVRNADVDNESGPPLEAVVVAEQANFGFTRLTLDNVDASRCEAPAAFVKLLGLGAAFPPARVHARGLSTFDRRAGTVLRADGTGWGGTVDASEFLRPAGTPAAAGSGTAGVTVLGP